MQRPMVEDIAVSIIWSGQNETFDDETVGV
jgi:hypothetical protein